MNTYYRVTHTIAHYELDNWEHGCIGGNVVTVTDSQVSSRDRYPTVRSLCESLRVQYDLHINDLDLNACGEPGRIDLQFYSVDAGCDCAVLDTSNEWDEFRAGKRDLYLCSMSVYVEQVRTGIELKLN